MQKGDESLTNMQTLPRLKERYLKNVASEIRKDLDIKNPEATPRLKKAVVNMGIGDLMKNKEMIEAAKKDLATITGQTPSVRAAKVSVASFGVRRGMPVGLTVTLRGDRMYSFVDRLFSIVLPRLRDFRGVSKESFDEHGNYTLGIREHSVFPEVDITKSQARGLEVTLVTSAKTKDEAYSLLEKLGMPFEKS
jgi:large subunit ribosomal protein L5